MRGRIVTDLNRRNILLGGSAVAAAAVTAACSSDSTPAPNSGGNVDQNAGSVNDLQDQEQKLTIQPFNVVKRIPDQAYPSSLLMTSLEMRNLRERLLRFNDPSKLGYAHLFTPQGALVMIVPVKGKISSTQSQMTTDLGIYKRDGGSSNSYWGTTTPVKLPGDDLSFGPNEGGDSGKFFFTPDDVYVFWDGPVLYSDAPLKVNQPVLTLEYRDGSKPSTVAPKA